MRRALLTASVLALAVAVSGCAHMAAAPAAPAAPAVVQTPAPDAAAEDARLTAFLDAAFREQLALSPESLSQFGSKQHNDRLDDYTRAGSEQSLALAERHLAEMRRQFDPARLSEQGRISMALFEDGVANQRMFLRWREHSYLVTNNGAPTSNIPVLLLNNHPVANVADAEAYISRLRDVERVMGEVSTDLMNRHRQGLSAPALVYPAVITDARNQLRGAPFDNGEPSVLLADFSTKVDALEIPAEEKARLKAGAAEALSGPFRRGYERMIGTLETISREKTDNNGVWAQPNGQEFYQSQLRFFTTTDLTADQIHDIGLREVERLHREFEALKQRVGFEGTLQEFFEHVRTDPRFTYPNTAEGRQAYLDDSTRLINQAMADAPRFFHHLPRAPLEVRAVEAFRENTASTAFYERPTADGSRPGVYYVNLRDMTQVLKPEVDATAYHEGAPGHHFQLARAIEQEGLPLFRRFAYYGAYIEGWGLYAEKLAREMGYYQDPWAEYGRLSLELWRAGRLVVDTGIHSKGWSRDQAMDWFRTNMAMSEGDVVREIDRYITNPGQATCYMIGQLKIFELRARAQAALGDRFDIRDFHEVVLASGPVPLSLLEQRVDAWIAAGGPSQR
ncbi:DUF885 domain-containing protein [Brevundimonas sp. 2R-24]|uniref:DUF885 domain-containing protein n=1 Tax=Peiella sedimenti TaxID=3061083 RepID=A0ABT8SLA1_9CAUL|nr:DUF885 domain-containing protein [Caulobacteraceae bacterium XZ-24]